MSTIDSNRPHVPIEERAEHVSKVFKILWPIVLSGVGLVFAIAFIVVPSLRNPPLIGAIGGFLGVLGIGGTAVSRKGGRS